MDIDLQQIDKLLQKRLKNFATKDDLKSFATKDDLKKELSKYATKDDLKKVLSKHPNKEDLKKALDDLVVEITLNADKHKAEKSRVEDLEKRVEVIEEELQISSI